SVAEAGRYAEQDFLVTFGIQPTRPETGYGYINASQPASAQGEGRKINRFVEKPDLATATRYVESGEYFWNSGMFVFKPSRYLAELRTHNKDILETCRAALAAGKQDLDFIRIDRDTFSTCPDDSIDYAVMEKTTQAVMVPMNAC